MRERERAHPRNCVKHESVLSRGITRTYNYSHVNENLLIATHFTKNYHNYYHPFIVPNGRLCSLILMQCNGGWIGARECENRYKWMKSILFYCHKSYQLKQFDNAISVESFRNGLLSAMYIWFIVIVGVMMAFVYVCRKMKYKTFSADKRHNIHIGYHSDFRCIRLHSTITIVAAAKASGASAYRKLLKFKSKNSKLHHAQVNLYENLTTVYNHTYV